MSTIYGSATVMRPLLSNVPEPPPGASLTACPYCGRECWRLAAEPDQMPDATAACTNCAMNRGSIQRIMDAARFAKECGIVSEFSCPHCNWEFRSNYPGFIGIVPTHDFPKPCRSVCPGSGKKPVAR